MGILKEMFDENGDSEFEKLPAELLAKGTYKSCAETILSGYKTYRKRYVIKSVVLKMLVVLVALASSIMMLLTSEDSMMPVFMILVCVVIGVYFISEPINHAKKLKNGLADIEGTEYEVEITDQTIKISTVRQDTPEAEPDQTEEISEKTTEGETGDNTEDEIPATVIHLDSPIVDFIDRKDMFIICVKKSYVFIIPKSAFTEDEVQKTREKLSAILGIRFKIAD
ncbi:MAG: hypothetical protein ACI4JF_03655 [Oscillospiraceae bacterium]